MDTTNPYVSEVIRDVQPRCERCLLVGRERSTSNLEIFSNGLFHAFEND
jgi:hypothetical protein